GGEVEAIRRRVERLPELRRLIEQPGEFAVEPVGDPTEDEQQKRPTVLLRTEQQPQEHRDAGEPQDRQEVRHGHELPYQRQITVGGLVRAGFRHSLTVSSGSAALIRRSVDSSSHASGAPRPSTPGDDRCGRCPSTEAAPNHSPGRTAYPGSTRRCTAPWVATAARRAHRPDHPARPPKRAKTPRASPPRGPEASAAAKAPTTSKTALPPGSPEASGTLSTWLP